MDASERSQLSAIALLIVRATLWLLPGFFSRHFIEGTIWPSLTAGTRALPGFFSRHFIEGDIKTLTLKQVGRIAGILFPALH